MAVAIGIDLGTTMTSAAGLVDDTIHMAFNFDHGTRAIPSYVSFEEDGSVFVGDEAKKNAKMNPKYTIYDAKRAIGRSYHDKTIQEQINKWPFKLECRDENKPYYKILHNKRTDFYEPKDISAKVLEEVKKYASNNASFGQQEIHEAVVTVPAQFSDSQRKATIEAAKQAGLEILQLLNEPTAAATAYIYQDKGREAGKSETILVYDFGGGTLDVSVVRVEGGKIKVLGTEGDSYLGGRDIDGNLMEHFLEGELKEKFGDNIKTSDKSLNKLRAECENAKIALSANKKHRMIIDSLYQGEDFPTIIKRETFEALNQKLFDKTLDIVKTCLKTLKKKEDDIDQVVLVGGSSRIPRIQEMVSDFFGGKKLSKGVNPDEAIAFGAAVYAAKLKGNANVPQLDISIDEVVPRNIGIMTSIFDCMSVFCEKNTKVPTKKVRTYTNSADNQTTINFSVYEGSRFLCKDNSLLGQFSLTGLPPGKRRNKISVEVTFEISTDGTLHATAVEQSEGKKKEVVIKKQEALLTAKELHLQDELEKQNKEDEKHKTRVEVGKNLHDYAYKVKHYLEDNKEGSDVTEEYKQKMLKKAKEMITWVEGHTSATQDDFSKHLKELKEVCKPLGNIK